MNNRLFYNDLLKSELLKSATILISGTVLAQLVSVLLQPVLRRFFTPESFGVFSVYLSLVGILTVISSLRYDDAIVLPRKDKDSMNIIALSLLINLSFNILVFLIIILYGDKILQFLNLPGKFPAGMLYIIPAGSFLLGAYQSLNNWLIRKGKFYAVSANKLVRRASEGTGQISFAIIGVFNGLIYSDIIGQLANVATVTVQALKNGFSLRLISKIKIKYLLSKYAEFPKYNLIPALMSTCSYLLPPVFINKFFSPEKAGYFDLSKLLLSLPLAFIASSLSSVLLQKISERYNRRESILKELRPVFITVVLISTGEIILILLFGETIFSYVFGKQWITSGEISKIMVWSFAFNFIISSFSSLFIAMRRIKTYSIWQLFYFLAIVSLLFFINLQFTDFLKLYVLIEILCYLFATLVLMSILFRYETSLKRTEKKIS